MFALETERLKIRTWTAEDRAALASIMQDTQVVHYLRKGIPYGEKDLDDFFERQARQIAEYGVCMGAVVEKESGNVVGIAGTQPLGTTPDYEIGWILARSTWGKGYATEAGGAAMRYVFETLGRDRVVAIIDPDNLPSKRVAARLGMEYEARYTGAELGHRTPEIVVDLFAKKRE